MLDKRVSFWDVNMRKVRIGNNVYVLQCAPERGGSCIVYSALKQEKVGGKVYEHRVLLKEFYPVLTKDAGAGITRLEDGNLVVPKSTLESEEYQSALQRFQDTYGTMLELANADEGAEYLSIPTGLIEDYGTWYLEEAYDSGITLAELFVENETKFFGEEVNYNFAHFLDIFCKCLGAVERLHCRGYYHLDLKPWNVSFTRGGNIKLFDTDTFLKKSDLENSPVLLETEGYSAPEIGLAARRMQNAPYWIGPWTDIYSLTQFICWYLYGRPLKEEELDEQLQYLEEKILKSFKYYSIPKLSPKGIFRLKFFLMKNLSSHRDTRNQSIMDEMLPEVEVIRDYLFYDTQGEPIDNFKESTEPVFGYEEELAKLEELLIYGDEWSKTAAALTGINPEKREDLARYYATMHRLDYGDIVEIHCSSFEGLIENIEVRPGVESDLKNPHWAPVLFLIFDEQEKDTLTRKEAAEMNRLIGIRKCQVLFVGRHNRCQNRMKEFDADVEIPTVDMDDRQIEQELLEITKLIDQDEDFPRWSWRNFAVRCLLGILIYMAGGLFIGLGTEMAEKYMYYDVVTKTYTYSSWWSLTSAMIVHLLGSGMRMAGLGVGIYCICDLLAPYGWVHFLDEYSWPIIAGVTVTVALTLPDIFWVASFNTLCEIFGYRYWEVIEICKTGLGIVVLVLWGVMMGLWLYRVISKKWRCGIVLKSVSVALLILSCVYIVLQTMENAWELLTYGLLWIVIGLLACIV